MQVYRPIELERPRLHIAAGPARRRRANCDSIESMREKANCEPVF
jgi:hypothetical protein